MLHPKVEPQPVCTDWLTVSRVRIERLVEKANATEAASRGLAELFYSRGVAHVLEYLLDADKLPLHLASTLNIHQEV